MAKAKEKIEEGFGKTYSANYGQTKTIKPIYENGAWYTATNSKNQAETIFARLCTGGLIEKDKLL
ncbi:MAG: hypothetical protein MRY78_15650 [Saprospiraceae bacterium]|nr:hypothetical protein [Saprospiraceae bacterium]